jgi:hypothetical protein
MLRARSGRGHTVSASHGAGMQNDVAFKRLPRRQVRRQFAEE